MLHLVLVIAVGVALGFALALLLWGALGLLEPILRAVRVRTNDNQKENDAHQEIMRQAHEYKEAIQDLDLLYREQEHEQARRPGVLQGRLEEMSMIDLMRSLEMGQKSCGLAVQRGGERAEFFFLNGQCVDAHVGSLEGDEAVYKVLVWSEGQFEIDFNATSTSTRRTTTQSTADLIFEGLRRNAEQAEEHSRETRHARRGE